MIMKTIEEILVKSHNELSQFFLQKHRDSDHFIYRGQSDSSWPIQASFDRGRSGNQVDTEKTYQEFFKRFKSEYKFRYGSEEVDDELMALAQHYGLLTRLVDWTDNPYVSAYFSTSSFIKTPAKKSCAIFCFNFSAYEREITGDSLEILRSATKNNDRIRLQAGCLMRNKTNFRSIEDFLESLSGITSTILTKLIISRKTAQEIFEHLEIIGINNESLFGGLEAFSKDMNAKLL